MMHLIGLDPGFASIGYAVLAIPANARPHAVAFGVLVTEASAKKHKVLAVEDNVRRAIEIARALRKLFTLYPSTLALCAEAMSFPRSSSIAAKMAMCWGVIASLSDATNTPILQAAPVRVKVGACGIKTATKEEVQAAMVERYPEIIGLRESIPETKWEHPHDALAVAHLMLESDVVRLALRAA